MLAKFILLILLLAGCAQKSPPASLPSIAENGEWHNMRKPGFVSFKDDEIKIGVSAYNSAKYPSKFSDEFFVFAEILVETPGYEFDPAGVSLKIGNKSYAAQGFDCKPPAPVESKTERKPKNSFTLDDQYNCAWLRFDLPPPSLDTAFHLEFKGLKFHGKEVDVPLISFKKDIPKSMFGF